MTRDIIRDRPQGADLLNEARHVLTDIVMPKLSADTRYQLLMAIRAIKLAERQFQANVATEARLTGMLAGYQNGDVHDKNPTHSLAGQIRNGEWDASAQIFDFLQEVAVFKLKETGP